MSDTTRSLSRTGALIIILGVLAACGGGSGGADGAVSPAPADAADPPDTALVSDGGLPGGAGGTGGGASPPDAQPGQPTTPPVVSSPSPVAVPPGSIYPNRGDPVMGVMGQTAPWSLVPLHVAITTDGRVLALGRDPDFAGEMIYEIWDWTLGTGSDSHLVLPNRIATDLFCSNQLLLTTGEMLMTGGDRRINAGPGNVGNQTNRGNSDANVFNGNTNQITRRGQMHEPRWYATMTMLPWGEVFVQGGAIDVNTGDPSVHTEVASQDGSQFRQLTGFQVPDLPWYYPRNFATPSGDVIGFAHNFSYRIDPRGNGTRRDTGHVPQLELNNGSIAVMYRPGKVLIGGGGNPKVMSVDIRGATPAYDLLPPMSSQRLWGMATVLPDGRVMVGNGGTSDTSISGAPLGVPARHVEIYNPDNNSWTIGASSQHARLYHSTTLLLPDATVLIGGGGLPGPVTNMHAEIYYPPYLFRPDGSLAPRPLIDQAPATVNPATSFSIISRDAANIRRISLIKTGAATHSYDMDQRFLPLEFTRSGDTLQVSLPSDPGHTPPGFYHVFLLDANGVPSVSHIMRINQYTGALSPVPALGVETVTVGGNKGLRRELGCAVNEVLTGLHGRAFDRVFRMGPVCTPIDPATGRWSGPSIQRATDGDQFIDANAPTSGVFNSSCPTNQAVAGFSGAAAGEFIGRIELSCRPLTAGGNVNGTPTAAPAIGMAAASTTTNCPNNKPAVGITGLANYDAYYRFGLRCGA